MKIHSISFFLKTNLRRGLVDSSTKGSVGAGARALTFPYTAFGGADGPALCCMFTVKLAAPNVQPENRLVIMLDMFAAEGEA